MKSNLPGELELALREVFPTLSISVHVRDYGNGLGVTYQVGDRRHLVLSPKDSDYRQHDMRWWLHRFSQDINARTKK